MPTPLNPTSPQPQRSFTGNLAAMMGICLAFMLTALNPSVVGLALPRIVADLQGYELYPWAASSYLVGNTVMIPLAGRLGDLYGRKPFLLVAVALFALASLACGLAQSMLQLILYRGVQGLAGGIFLGVASASVADLFPESAERLRWQVYMSAAFGLSMAVGPSFGGWVSEHASWRYVFYANLPIALAAFSMVWAYLPRVRHGDGDRRLDGWGVALLTMAVCSRLFSAEQSQAHGPLKPLSVGLWAATALLTWAFVRQQYLTPAPVIPPDVMDNAVARRLMLLSAGTGMTMFLLVFYTPLLLQGSFHLSPEKAGYAMTPLLVFITVGSIANARILPRLHHAERLITLGLAGTALGCVLMTQLSEHTPLVWMMLVFALCGMSLGFQLPNLTLQMMEAVGRQHFGVAGGLSQFTRTVGSMVGIGLASAVVNSVYQGRIASAVAAAHISHPRLLELLATPQLLIRQQDELEMRALAQTLSLDPLSLLDAARQGLAQGTQAAFWFCAGVAALSTLVSLGLPRYSIRKGQAG